MLERQVIVSDFVDRASLFGSIEKVLGSKDSHISCEGEDASQIHQVVLPRVLL